MTGLIDLHTHTVRCGHATGTMEAYIEAAITRGITRFGISDHSYWMVQATADHYAMHASELSDYVADVQQLQQRYNQQGARPFQILLGMEMDYVPSRIATARAEIARYPWDYLIGSVHNIGLEKLQEPALYQEWNIDDVCEIYFHRVGDMLRDRFCDVVGHLDLPKKMGSRPQRGLRHYIEPLIPELLAAGVAVEINTSGKDNPAGEFMPGWDTVALLAEAGVPLTLGSDAHAPQQVARHFDEAITELRRIGVRELSWFEKRERKSIHLNEIKAA